MQISEDSPLLPEQPRGFKIFRPEEEQAFRDRVGFQQLLEEWQYNPLGGDHFVELAAAGFSMVAEEDPEIFDLLHRVRTQRAQENNQVKKVPEMALALMHSLNYVQMFVEGNLDYPYSKGLDSPEKWRDLYKSMLYDPEKRALYEHLLLTKEIQTTNPNRGVALPFIINHWFGDNPPSLRVGDFGASANWVMAQLVEGCRNHIPIRELYTLNGNGAHSPIEDHTHAGNLRELVLNATWDAVEIEEAIGIDHIDPFADEEHTKWFMACRHFKDVNPQALAKTEARMRRYQNVPGVHLHIADALDSGLPEHSLDMAVASTFMYLLPKGWYEEALHTIEGHVKKDGVAVITDYLEVDEQGEIHFVNDRGEGKYRTAVKGIKTNGRWMELFKYSNSRIEEIYNGRHLREFLAMTTS